MARANTGRLLIVSYHYVRRAGGPFPGIYPVTATELRAQLEGLMAALHAATPAEAEAFALGEHSFPRDAFLTTFDDGLTDHAAAARDVLGPLGLRGAFFVCTLPQAEHVAPSVHKVHWLRANMPPADFDAALRRHLPAPWSTHQLGATDRERAARTYIHDTPPAQALKFLMNFLLPAHIVEHVTSAMLAERGVDEARFCAETFLDAAGIRALHDAGHTVGLHGHRHTAFSSMSASELHADVERNAALLTQMLGARPAWLAYPYGRQEALPAQPTEFCERSRVRVAFTMQSGWNEGEHGSGQPSAQHATLMRRITPNELPAVLAAAGACA